MQFVAYVRTRKQAKKLAELVAMGQTLARAGRTHDAKVVYTKARHYRRIVHIDLSSQFGAELAHHWDHKAAHMMTPLATLVSDWEV